MLLNTQDECPGEITHGTAAGEHTVPVGQVDACAEGPAADHLDLDVVLGGAPDLFTGVQIHAEIVARPVCQSARAGAEDPGTGTTCDGEGVDKPHAPTDRVGTQAAGGQLRQVQQVTGF